MQTNLLTRLAFLLLAGIRAGPVLLRLPPLHDAAAGSWGLNGHPARAAVLPYALGDSFHLRHSLRERVG